MSDFNLRIHVPKPTNTPSHAEREILNMIVKGWNNPRIAKERGTSHRTIKNQIHHLMLKLDIHTRVELALWWREHEHDEQQNETAKGTAA